MVSELWEMGAFARSWLKQNTLALSRLGWYLDVCQPALVSPASNLGFQEWNDLCH